MNKNGKLGDQISFFYFLFLMIIIALGIAGGAYLFYGGEHDFREGESEILTYLVEECMKEKDVKWENFYEECGISKGAMEKGKIILKICKEQCGKEEVFVFGSNFEACEFKGVFSNKNYPKCSTRKTEVKGITYEIIARSNNFARRQNE